MLTPNKLAAITLGGIGVVGGGVGAFYALKGESISIEKKLESENKKLLGEGNETLWGIKLATYNKIKTTNTELNLNEATWDKLKTWCFEKTKTTFDEKNKELYEGIKEVCTVPSQQERLINKGKTLSDKENWTAKAKAYPDSKPISTITKGADTATKLEEWCTAEFAKEYVNETTNNDTLVEKWCTK